MLRNYLKIAFRNLWRNKAFSVLNIMGLTIGMASAVLILLWLANELGQDRFHEKLDRLYTVNNRDHFNGQHTVWPNTPKILAPTMKQDYPEVEDAVRVQNWSFLFTFGEEQLNLSGNMVDPGFLTMFSFPLINGNAATALSDPNGIVLTEKGAEKIFGRKNPVGKTVRLDNQYNFTVTGLMKDLPANTAFKFDYLLPFSHMKTIGADDSNWVNNGVLTYLLLKPGARQAAFDAKIKNITIDHTRNGKEPATTEVFTQPLREAYLFNKSEDGRYVAGRMVMVRMFAIVAAFILLIACINFMNLSTARSEKRAKEVGIRKVAGAPRARLVSQFLGESVLLALLAGLLALLLVQVSLSGFNQLVSKELTVPYANPTFWLLALLFVLVTGVVAGSYPAFFLSAYKPVQVLKGTFKSPHALVTPRKVLVVLQFSFAIALIICTLVITGQIRHAQDRDNGYDQDRLVFVNFQGEVEKHYDAIKQKLLSTGAAVAVTKSMSPVTQRYSDSWGFTWTGSTEEDKKIDFVRMASDADFVKTLGLGLAEGRDIDIHAYPGDSTALLLNQTAVKEMRLKNPIGAQLKADDKTWTVVGVVKDFIFESPFQKVQQLIVFGPASWFNTVHFKLNPAKPASECLKLAEGVFKEFNPLYPFDYKFVDEAYERKFEGQKRTGWLAALFAGLTIFISCLGLFGLAAYTAQNRIKEIGVRKVLGASVANITGLLSKDFLKLVFISLAVATPLAWWVMSKWLESFQYRAELSAWVFVLAGLLSVAIALFTVGYQAVKAALANPVKSLRTE